MAKKVWAGAAVLVVLGFCVAIGVLAFMPATQSEDRLSASRSPTVQNNTLPLVSGSTVASVETQVTPAGILKVSLVEPGRLPVPAEATNSLWNRAKPLMVRLGMVASTDPQVRVDLQALSDGQAIVFLARWKEAGPPPGIEASAVTNKFTIFWRLDPQFLALHPDTCHTSCHTVYTAPTTPTRLNRFNLSAIGVSSAGGLEGVGQWEAGQWTLSWSRSLMNNYMSDVQFSDFTKSYPFRIEVFPWVESGAPQVSPRYMMEFEKVP